MAVRGRAYWKGSLRLSLVSIAVEVHNAVDASNEIHFNQIHKPTGKRVNHIKSVQGVGPIESYDIVKGFEIEKDQYVILEPREIDAIRLESKKTLDLTQFVEKDDIGDLPNLKIDPEMISIATEIIKRKSKVFDPDQFEDHYAVALADLVKKKSQGKRLITAGEPTPASTNVVNLMDALRKSLQGENAVDERKVKPKKKPARA
jgi:non-homologous end joining protein Ku